jgi:hypothetical protein
LENGFLRKWPRVKEGQQLQSRKRILLFSIFLLISATIWLLNALSENYTSVIDYPLIYTDIPEEKVFVGEMPEHLELQINAQGYALLRYKMFKKPVPISFKVSAFKLNSRGDSSSAHILTRYLKDQIARQLPGELQLLEIRPDTLQFQFARRVSKRVKVMTNFAYTLDKQFTIKDEVRFTPDSLDISGPDLILDTLRYVYTVKSELGELSRNYSNRVRLLRHADIEYPFTRVDCFIELERFTEVQVPIDIEVLNVPDSIQLQTFPGRVKLTCKVGLSKYDLVGGHPFRAVADYQLIDERSGVLDVEVLNIPGYMLSYEYYPQRVEFLKSRK